MQRAILFQKDVNFPVAVFNTGSEMNSMNHTRFWAQQILEHRVPPDQFIMWLGHDDELDVYKSRTVMSPEEHGH